MQLSAAGTAGNNFPVTPDLSTTNLSMSATAGKVALANQATALGCGATATPCTLPDARIVDLVSWGASNDGEGGTTVNNGTNIDNTKGGVRKLNGCQDTDNNNNDFDVVTNPVPRNSASSANVCGAPTPTPTPSLSINDVTQAEGDSGTTNFVFTVSLSQPANTGGVSFTVNTADGTATAPSDYTAIVNGAGSIPQGSSSTQVTVSVNGDTTQEPNETFFVNITNVTGAGVTDAQGQGTITNDDVTLTKIHDIQGNGTTSPIAGQNVTTRGVVTAIKAGSSGGFFIQEPDATVDADPNTSEGIFVFTGSTVPAAAVVGNLVQVNGTVQEFIPSADPNQHPETELSGTITASVLSTGNTLPAPVTITAADTLVNNLDNLEKYEGMRVTVPSLTVVAGTQGTITEPSATVSSNGVFYGVVTGVARPFREPGVNASDPLPPGSPANVPRFDENPERIRIDSDGQPGTTALDVSAGAVLTNVTGPLDYGFRTYTILPDTTLTGTGVGPTAAPTPTDTEFTVASFNMERFFDTVNDPNTQDAVLTQAAFDKRVNKASLIIRTIQRYPDVIGVEEMENLSTLQAVAAKVNSDAQTIDGLPNPNYVAYLAEGNDIGGIDVGFLVKESRITTVGVTQIELAGCNHTTGAGCYTYTNPNTGNQELLNDRPPLVLQATVPRPALYGGGTIPFTVIVNHLRSLSSIDDDVTVNGTGTEGGRVRAKRKAQAEFLANYIQSRQVSDPNEKIITIGDMNAFRINDGYVDVIGTVLGT
ncbi:MAG TPA: Calx-beta domain-containing protein, partial [Pyrinomonadaceae bacterium]|nr:Calx-beta domain-containing protein [Pyrinomonadaceae bacterium]